MPNNKDYFIKNTEGYKTKLAYLDRKFSDTLASCKKDIIIHGGHSAFGSLARRYNLKYLSAYKGFSPDAEPTPKNLIELSKKLKDYNIKYIFYEELITPKVSEAIARETQAKLLLLHGAQGYTPAYHQSAQPARAPRRLLQSRMGAHRAQRPVRPSNLAC